MPSHTIALLGPGAMGSAMGLRLFSSGAGPIMTNLAGRSEAAVERAKVSGMAHASYSEIVAKCTIIYSVVPPKEAARVAEDILNAYRELAEVARHDIIFADCNAVNPETIKQIAQLFTGTRISFLDGVIIGFPPSDTNNPGIYVSAHPDDLSVLDVFTEISTKFGLYIIPLKGEGAGIGDASALKMSHAAIVKGTIGICATSVLAAQASSPATAQGLLHAMSISQPAFLDIIIRLIPQMIPKAYRMAFEMEEVSGFVGGEESKTFEGIARLFERVAEAHNSQKGGDGGDVDTLLRFVDESKKTLGT
ncbi:6-phosphogluconate dehydrogenase C-terminal domain-like protein [Armillaria fumosa]|nr:6-phosphogluconate dehydrogenase C-terminal domain-like protein [Armillaria fumosa]